MTIPLLIGQGQRVGGRIENARTLAKADEMDLYLEYHAEKRRMSTYQPWLAIHGLIVDNSDQLWWR